MSLWFDNGAPCMEGSHSAGLLLSSQMSEPRERTVRVTWLQRASGAGDQTALLRARTEPRPQGWRTLSASPFSVSMVPSGHCLCGPQGRCSPSLDCTGNTHPKSLSLSLCQSRASPRISYKERVHAGALLRTLPFPGSKHVACAALRVTETSSHLPWSLLPPPPPPPSGSIWLPRDQAVISGAHCI